ncbi:MarR family winged helix-turn-helix transcriptional regulator [Demequina capsici]|uniref:MarR family winged helix-turn-helix transcriptional regulator n=1 Tax=Demequina capsici TaxID=3075620 RepID=A0AA96FET5_9MICO|nr:MarR family winged helix-turn-helix transcriptional regulator [Demequina sp. PMTSA13]WNM28300.1 MarR family winged helix-turn-helix transcriptional regulator [Demequina sp. PMTSA13]
MTAADTRGSAGAAPTVPAGAPRTRLANDAWESVLTAYSQLMRQFADEDIWADASMREYDVLYTLSKCDTPQRLSDLGRHVLLSQPGLSRLVDRLVDRGLVSRCADPADARASHLTLTQTGRDVQRRIGRAHGRSVAEAMSASLTDDELAQLRDLASKLSPVAPLEGSS